MLNIPTDLFKFSILVTLYISYESYNNKASWYLSLYLVKLDQKMWLLNIFAVNVAFTVEHLV